MRRAQSNSSEGWRARESVLHHFGVWDKQSARLVASGNQAHLQSPHPFLEEAEGAHRTPPVVNLSPLCADFRRKPIFLPA